MVRNSHEIYNNVLYEKTASVLCKDVLLDTTANKKFGIVNIIVYGKAYYILLDFISVSNPNYVFDIAEHQRDKEVEQNPSGIKKVSFTEMCASKNYYKKKSQV